MVNETVEKIKQLTDTLKSSAGPVSGETLAEDLGISRTAVWKIISRLKQRGYLIESSRAGYRLVSETEKPVPWELGTASEHVEYFDKLDSTMEKAAALLDSGCENGTTVIAGSQTEGVTPGRRAVALTGRGSVPHKDKNDSLPRPLFRAVYSGNVLSCRGLSQRQLRSRSNGQLAWNTRM